MSLRIPSSFQGLLRNLLQAFTASRGYILLEPGLTVSGGKVISRRNTIKGRVKKMEDQFNKQGSSGSTGSQYGSGSGSGSTGGQYGQGSSAAGTATKMKDAISDKAHEAKEKVADFGRKAVDKIDSSREAAAGSLDRTASALTQRGDSAASAARTAADKLQATADYVRQNDVKAMMGDLEEVIKRYPGQSLAAAAAVGFLVARLFRSND